MRRSLAIALLLAAAPARAQLQTRPLRLPAALDAELVAARLSGGAGDDLLVTKPPGAIFQRYTWPRDLLTLHPLPIATPADGGYVTGGRFEPSALAAEDLVYGTLDGLKVEFGADPAVVRSYPAIFPSPPLAIGQARMLPRPEAEVLASIATGSGVAGQLCVLDLAASRTSGTAPQVRFAVPPMTGAVDGDVVDRTYPLRLSPAARGAGLDDVVMPLYQGLFVLWHRSVPATAALGALDVAPVITGAGDSVGIKAWLPAGVSNGGSVLGAAAIDADGDGTPDLVFSYAFDQLPGVPGTILYARNTGDPTGLTTPPWGKLTGRADLSAIVDPLTLRQLPLAAPTMAVYDRALGQILVVQGDARAGFTVAQRLEAPGFTVREMFLADVVGSPAPDLVVYAVRAATEAEVWVYPDAFDAAPTVAFDPAPARALRGQDLPLAVAAADADSPFTVSWMVGGRFTPPVATGASWTVPGSLLCSVGTLDVTARAVDDLGVFAEAAAAVPVLGEPSLRLSGASPDRLPLPPGGAAGEAVGEAWPACGRTATFTWGDVGLPGLAETSLASTATSSRRGFAIPEAAYPAVLSGSPAMTLAAVDDLGASGTATLPLLLDAEGLVGVEVSVDRAVLARGEVAAATARLASRLGVALPGVRAAFRLSGLAPAGPVTAAGAAVAAGAGEAEAIVDLPAAGTPVTLSLPVRALGGPGAVSVELFASGGARLSPAVAPAASSERLPGCGCGGGGAGAPALLGLLALLGRRRRPR